MNQSAKAQEPSMEEILASIRRIIADDDARAPAAAAPPPPPPKPAPPKAAPPPPPPPKPAAPPPKPAAPPPKAAAPAPTEGAAMSQDDIDAMLAGFDSAPAAEPPVPEPPAETADVLDLTESMAAAVEPPSPPPAPAPRFRTIDGNSDVVFSEPPPRPEPPRAAEPPRMEAPERPLLSSTATAAVDSAFSALAQTVLVQNARTLEDLVKEMLRPMLKSWLDDNLPSLVERIVKAEIERVSRGRTGT